VIASDLHMLLLLWLRPAACLTVGMCCSRRPITSTVRGGRLLPCGVPSMLLLLLLLQLLTEPQASLVQQGRASAPARVYYFPTYSILSQQ
jgi:hypothetical protein